MNGSYGNNGFARPAAVGMAMESVGRFLYQKNNIKSDFRFHGVIDSHDRFIGHVGEILIDENSQPAYFTIVPEGACSKIQACPIEFIKSIESGNVYLLEDFDDIRGEDFYSLSSLMEREAYHLGSLSQKLAAS